jgi:hypothetical protein
MPPAFVQIAQIDVPGAGSSPYSIPFGSNNTLGNLLVYTQRNNTDVASAISDTLTNTWIQTSNIRIWYVKNCKAGANTLSVTNGSGHLQASVVEYSGCDTVNPLDQITSSDATGSGTTAASPSITPTKSGCLIISTGSNSTTNTPSITAGSGYMLRSTSSSNSCIEDQVQSVAAPITGTLTYSGSVNWIQGVASFLPAQAGPTQNYVNTGANNFVSQEMGFGVQFRSWPSRTVQRPVTWL